MNAYAMNVKLPGLVACQGQQPLLTYLNSWDHPMDCSRACFASLLGAPVSQLATNFAFASLAFFALLGVFFAFKASSPVEHCLCQSSAFLGHRYALGACNQKKDGPLFSSASLNLRCTRMLDLITPAAGLGLDNLERQGFDKTDSSNKWKQKLHRAP
eukprot:scaffold216424_cov13-Tisochrysis_lutea.AAC.1